MRAPALALAVVALAACESPVATALDPEPVAPTAELVDLYLSTAACAGVERPAPERVQWYAADVQTPAGRTRLAMWQRPHRIYLQPRVWAWLAGGNPADAALARDVVRHEALHDILQAGNEMHGHPCDPLEDSLTTPEDG